MKTKNLTNGTGSEVKNTVNNTVKSNDFFNTWKLFKTAKNTPSQVVKQFYTVIKDFEQIENVFSPEQIAELSTLTKVVKTAKIFLNSEVKNSEGGTVKIFTLFNDNFGQTISFKNSKGEDISYVKKCNYYSVYLTLKKINKSYTLVK